MGDLISSRSEWKKIAMEAIRVLASLGPNEYFDEESEKYHPVHIIVEKLSRSLFFDIEAFRRRFPSEKGRQLWLPENPEHLTELAAEEVAMRLEWQRADERFVDGALDNAFQTGCLKAALERLVSDFEKLRLRDE